MEEGINVIEHLSTAIGEQLEKQRKKSEPVPEVYTSGMRGAEKPPHLREQKKQVEKKPVVDKDGKRDVTFRAKPKVKVSDEVETLKKQVAELTKKLNDKNAKPKLKI